MAKEQRVIRIHGKVQGVGYRFFATRVARRLGLKGYITNTRDGSVEAAVEGEKSAIDEWVEELKEGPRYAEGTRIDQETKDFPGKLGEVLRLLVDASDLGVARSFLQLFDPFID